MTMIPDIMVGLVAVLHSTILVLEMFLWDTAPGMTAFGHTQNRS